MTDSLIIDAMNDKKFEVDMNDYTLANSYKSRGFRVTTNNNGSIKVSWFLPSITEREVKNFKLLNGLLLNFTASNAYLRMTNGNDLRHVTNRIVSNMLQDGYDSIQTYGVNNDVVIELYSYCIKGLLAKNKRVFIHSGVLSLKPNYYNSIELTTDINGNIVKSNVDQSEVDFIITSDDFTVYGDVEW